MSFMTGVSNPIKVLLLASGDLWAGAEAVVYQLAVALRAKPTIQHTVVLLNHGRLETMCRQEGIVTHVIDETRLGFSSLLLKLITVCRCFRPDIIHAHRYKENLLATLTATVCGQPKLITTVHGLSEEMDSSFKGTIKGALNHFLLRSVFDTTVAVSRDIAVSLEERYGVPANKLATIVNGIDVRNGTRAKKTARGDMITIGSAGRLFPVKDYPLMVDIARLTYAKRANVHFVLAGDGPQKETILKRIRTYGLEDRFTLLGQVNDMSAFYAGLDIYINTSTHEGLPMTVLEAMARHMPVVAFDVGGLGEIVSHGHDGYLIKERDAGAFSRSLIELIDDVDRLDTFGKNARNTVHKEFSITRMTESYYGAYARLVRESRP